MKSIIKRNGWKIVTSIAFWIILWQFTSTLMGREILIPSPIEVVKALLHLLKDIGFWSSLAFSFFRIVFGFFLAMIIGTILATISASNIWIKDILYIPITIIKATPVVSFIIIALIWIKSENLSVFISFLMVLPIIYTNTLKGIEEVDHKLLEMARVFRVSIIRKVRYIYIPEIMPFFTSAVSVSLGLCWKSGIAAEIIGLPTGSIGEQLYNAKIFLNTSEVFAWTIVIVGISVIFEKIFMSLLRKLQRRIEGHSYNS
jgi:NitT/TauT family transport system permease protein